LNCSCADEGVDAEADGRRREGGGGGRGGGKDGSDAIEFLEGVGVDVNAFG